MPAQFDLIITATDPNHTAEFRLLDAHGVQLAYRQTDFKTIAAGHQHGLFDLRNYLRLYVEEGQEVVAVAEIGVGIAEEVLGQEIFEQETRAERSFARFRNVMIEAHIGDDGFCPPFVEGFYFEASWS